MPDKQIKVRLMADLTQYGAGLTAGTEGITVGRQGMWSRGSDRFITVNFPGIATLDVLWKSLEIIDQDVLKEIDLQKKAFEESLKTAYDVVLCLGPKGGFRSLSYTYIDAQTGCSVHTSNGFRTEAIPIIEKLKAYQIPIREEIAR